MAYFFFNLKTFLKLNETLNHKNGFSRDTIEVLTDRLPEKSSGIVFSLTDKLGPKITKQNNSKKRQTEKDAHTSSAEIPVTYR